MCEVRSLANDLKFGLTKETEYLPVIKDFFGEEKLEKTKDTFSIFDFQGKDRRYELKSRRCSVNRYLTTIVPVSKSKTENVCFVFGFIDGLYYIHYNEELFSKFDIKQVSVYRDGIQGRPKAHYEIPVSLLVRIDI
jgi:hypothetical protein